MPARVRFEPRPAAFEGAPEVAFLGGVTEPGQP